MKASAVLATALAGFLMLPAVASDAYSGIPGKVRAQIKAKCVNRYPDDYMMQDGCIMVQSDSYLKVHGDEAAGASSKKPAAESTWCHAKEPGARILASANPNDLDPDWTGENYVGTGAALKPSRQFTKNDFAFIEGKLFSTRGGVLEEHVFALASEWECDR